MHIYKKTLLAILWILKISSLFQLYSDDDLVNYSKAKFELFKNKNQKAINILNSFEIENPLFKTAQYESIFLEVKSGNYNNALENSKIKSNGNIKLITITGDHNNAIIDWETVSLFIKS